MGLGVGLVMAPKEERKVSNLGTQPVVILAKERGPGDKVLPLPDSFLVPIVLVVDVAMEEDEAGGRLEDEVDGGGGPKGVGDCW